MIWLQDADPLMLQCHCHSCSQTTESYAHTTDKCVHIAYMCTRSDRSISSTQAPEFMQADAQTDVQLRCVNCQVHQSHDTCITFDA